MNISVCVDTATGHYSPSGATSIEVYPCPAGYYCPLATGEYSINPCPEGT
jgi:hypothetical protein